MTARDILRLKSRTIDKESVVVTHEKLDEVSRRRGGHSFGAVIAADHK